ncbi:diguanylate cyclase domain-containing protein [Xylophilus sp. GOD-11R]|uniref:diguanylate cyclase domain-containing protein n=1 Tax=Xylophilus sp. GOD-11R TaxID=3089814 RepID=UPI00298BDABF|nr:diguanylate cyclase [Xylophilus sp. GOD-11R]WPB57273.1 diguanylate cyclase [Xylophilus sp. GOD-11R]
MPELAAATVEPPRPPLQSVLRSAMLGMVLRSVLLAGCLMTLLGGLMLRGQAAAELQLVARSVGYSLEAAVVFEDELAAAEALEMIAGAEDVAQAWVYDQRGRELVRWSRDAGERWPALRPWLARLLLPPQVDVPVRHGSETIGRVVLRGAGGGLLAFVGGGLVAVAASMLLSALASASAIRRVLRNILAPLREIAAVARAGRVERSLDRRVPPARIAEFHALGQDVNALLAELQSRHQGLQRENAHLAHRATTDALTGLHNRAVFEQALAEAIAAAGADGARLAVLFLDADRFKQINDGLGHAAGDQVLVAIAGRIRRQVRDGDVVARLGGDEFAVLLRRLTGAQDAVRIASAIEAGMAEPVALAGGGMVAASLSIGLAVFPDEADDASGLLRAADASMYRRKRARDRG